MFSNIKVDLLKVGVYGGHGGVGLRVFDVDIIDSGGW